MVEGFRRVQQSMGAMPSSAHKNHRNQSISNTVNPSTRVNVCKFIFLFLAWFYLYYFCFLLKLFLPVLTLKYKGNWAYLDLRLPGAQPVF